MAIDRASIFMYGLMFIAGSVCVFFSFTLGLWLPENGTVWDVKHHSGCETCANLVVKFIYKSNDEHYSGTFKERVKYPYESNTTLEDMYDLHPIGEPVNMYVNFLFNSGSTLNGYPWGYLAGIVPLAICGALLFCGTYLSYKQESKYDNIV